MNLVKDIDIWHRPPEEVSVGVEIPTGSRTKYKCKWNAIHLESILLAPLCCREYGFIHQTYHPLEAIVVIDEPTYPGCIFDARPVGLLKMLDSGEADDKGFACLSTIGRRRVYEADAVNERIKYAKNLFKRMTDV